MIKFAVYSKVDFRKKPEWLDFFEHNYVQDGWHVTLKQPCFIERADVSDIKRRLDALYLDEKNIDLIFDEVITEEEKAGGKTIMFRAKENEELSSLQEKIVLVLQGYDNYCNSESAIWEKDFKPHLTLASHLDKAEYEKVKDKIGEDRDCIAVIDSITFVVDRGDGVRHRTSYSCFGMR